MDKFEEPSKQSGRWIDFISDEDLAFVTRFIRASGSLKEVAKVYGVSYPTVRRRLDRLIATVEVLEAQQVRDPFEGALRLAYAQDRLDEDTLRRLLQAYHESRGGE